MSKLISRPWKVIKAYRCSWYQVQVYRLKQPYDHFGTPLPFVIERLEWQHYVTKAYCTAKEAREFFRRWTMTARLINQDKEFIQRQEKEMQLIEDNNKPPERPKFKVVTGGGNFDDPNWLSYVPEGTTFFAYDKNDPKQIDVEKYTLVLKYTKVAWLTLHLVDRDISPVYVDMLRFSLRKQHIEDIVEVE